MSSRMFQGVLLQLSEAAQTTIGVIDAEGNVISCSDTTVSYTHLTLPTSITV